jgi:hypothetical protein
LDDQRITPNPALLGFRPGSVVAERDGTIWAMPRRGSVVGIVALPAAATVGARWLSRHRAQQFQTRAAKTRLRHILTAEQVAWSNNGKFSPASGLESVHSRLPPLADYPTTPTAMIPGIVYMAVLDDARVELSAVVGNKLYTIVQSNEAGNPSTRYGITALPAGRPDPARVASLSW